MKKHIPNTLTSINLLIGIVGIYYVLTDNYLNAIYFVLIASVFDFLDGLVARLLNVKSEFGKELDSLSDLVSFGLLPSFFMLKLLNQTSELYWVALMVALCSALRLAKFNIDESQTTNFRGLPTPANAIMLTSLSMLSFQLSEFQLIVICILSSSLLVSRVRLMGLKFESFGWDGNQWKWLLIIGSLSLVLVFKWTFLPLIIPYYIVISIIKGLIVN